MEQTGVTQPHNQAGKAQRISSLGWQRAPRAILKFPLSTSGHHEVEVTFTNEANPGFLNFAHCSLIPGSSYYGQCLFGSRIELFLASVLTNECARKDYPNYHWLIILEGIGRFPGDVWMVTVKSWIRKYLMQKVKLPLSILGRWFELWNSTHNKNYTTALLAFLLLNDVWHLFTVGH